jgi:tetratricopeptide (TPR) repeat protein
MRGFVLASALLAFSLDPRPARADLAPRPHVDLSTPAKRQVTELCTQSAAAMMRGDPAGALALAERALGVAADDPWAHYDRAVALGGLGRVDQAVAEYRLAQAHFGDDAWGKSIAIYGRAHLLAEHQRCEQAEAAYEEYASFVARDAPKDAEMALAYAGNCPLPSGPPAVSLRAGQPDQARAALAEARRREAYARTIERWVTRVERTAPFIGSTAQPDAQARLEQVRQRAQKLEASARADEHAAMTALTPVR